MFVDFDICHGMVSLKNIILRDLDQLFESKKCETLISRTRLDVPQKMHGKTFVDFDITHRGTTLRKLYSVTITYLLKVKILNVNLSETASASAEIHRMTFIDIGDLR